MTASKKVLVMDDSELVLDTVKEALETSGFSVVTAKDLTQLEERCSRGCGISTRCFAPSLGCA